MLRPKTRNTEGKPQKRKVETWSVVKLGKSLVKEVTEDFKGKSRVKEANHFGINIRIKGK